MLTFEPRVLRTEYPAEEVWVQSMSDGRFELGVQLNKSQYSYLSLSREQLEQVRVNIDAALLEQV